MGDFRLNSARVCGVVILCGMFRDALCNGLGKCPVYPQLPNFDIQRMTGTWYEVERSFYLVEIAASCTQLDISLNDRGYLMISVNTIHRWTGSASKSYGVGIPSHQGSSTFRYKLNNRMPYVIGRMLPGAGLYNILFTDYTQFAIVWSCTSVSVAHADRMWILGREREIDARVRAQIYSIMSQVRLDPDRLILSKNNNCTLPIN